MDKIQKRIPSTFKANNNNGLSAVDLLGKFIMFV
jgi:hypothetical protein